MPSSAPGLHALVPLGAYWMAALPLALPQVPCTTCGVPSTRMPKVMLREAFQVAPSLVVQLSPVKSLWLCTKTVLLRGLAERLRITTHAALPQPMVRLPENVRLPEVAASGVKSAQAPVYGVLLSAVVSHTCTSKPLNVSTTISTVSIRKGLVPMVMRLANRRSV